MQILLTYKSKQIFWLFIKLCIVFGCFFFIYRKLFLNSDIDWKILQSSIFNLKIFTSSTLFLLLLFSFFNWFFEILKWQKLVNVITTISLSYATQQTLASLTTSLITPNRIGEYGAKAIYYRKSLQKKIVALNFIGNIYQLFATLFFGVIGFGYLLYKYPILLNLPKVSEKFNIVILIIFFLGVLFFSKKIKHYVKKIIIFFKSISLKTNLVVLILSLTRYVVFSHQFYILLLIFKVEISYINAIMVISSTYLIASIIPVLSFFDVVVKSSIAIWLFSFFNVNSTLVLQITTLMWILNFVIPSLIGSYFVLTYKTNIA